MSDARLVVWCECEVNRGDGDHVRRVEDTELGEVPVVDDEPVFRSVSGFF